MSTLSPDDLALLEAHGYRLAERAVLDAGGRRVGAVSGGGQLATTTLRLRGKVWLPIGDRSAVERAMEAER